MSFPAALTPTFNRWLILVLAVVSVVLVATNTLIPITGWLRSSWGVPSYGGW